MIVPWGILHKVFASFFDPLKNVTVATKNRTKVWPNIIAYIWKSVNLSQILAQCEIVQDDEIYLW